jgi:hypothetical protein
MTADKLQAGDCICAGSWINNCWSGGEVLMVFRIRSCDDGYLDIYCRPLQCVSETRHLMILADDNVTLSSRELEQKSTPVPKKRQLELFK